MTRRVAALLTAGTLLCATPPAIAYLKLGFDVGGRVVAARWPRFPVRYFVTNRDASVTAAQFQTALQGAFDTWAKVPTALLSGSAQFGGFVSADPFVEDTVTVIGFRSRPDLERTLGSTTFESDKITGELIAADIFINSAFPWSVAGSGEPGRYDLQSILTHEVGHLFGLGHSALGETDLQSSGARQVLGKRAVMFPIAFPTGNILDRTLQDDDIAGISDIYPAPAFQQQFGAINGRVTLNGRGLFGAHVAALNPQTGALIGGFTLDDQGQFVISGLTPGVYVVRAEPLDDGAIESFFSGVTVNVNFRPAYAPRLVAVPAGGASGSIEVKVQSK